MRRTIAIVIVAVVGLGGVLALQPRAATRRGRRCGCAGGGRGARPPMPVEFATVKRAPIAEQILVVGNLIGAATVEVVPRANGRLQIVDVKLGDPVRQGQIIARVEDSEFREQVRQAEAVLRGLAGLDPPARGGPEAGADQPRSLAQPLRAAAAAAADLRRRRRAAPGGAWRSSISREAQFEAVQGAARRAEDHASRTRRSSRRSTASSASATSTPARSPARTRRWRRSSTSARCAWSRTWSSATCGACRWARRPTSKSTRTRARTFKGRVSRIAPVFDPATRTAEIEIEVPNVGYRLKPGMYSRVQLTISTRGDAHHGPAQRARRSSGQDRRVRRRGGREG